MREAIIIGTVVGLFFFACGAVMSALAIKYASSSILWDFVLWGGVGLMLISAVTLGLYISSQLAERTFMLPAVFVNLGICFLVLGVVWHFTPSEKELMTDVILKFVYPQKPVLVLINRSGSVARQVRLNVVLWNLDDPRTYINPNPLPNSHDPLPIPAATFDFLRPHIEATPQTIFGPSVAPFVRPGQRLVGTAMVDCPDCERGHTYMIYIVYGEGGWYLRFWGKTTESYAPHRASTKRLFLYTMMELWQCQKASAFP
jgi:hypothetical protein